MKPRNKKEAKFLKISNRFTKQIPIQNKNDLRNWVIDKVLDKKLLFSNKYMHYCTECNHKWKGDIKKSFKLKKVTCPNCAQELTPFKSYSASVKNIEYFYKVETFEKNQMVRIFRIFKYSSKKKPPILIIKEVVRHFIEDTGGIVTFALRGCMGGYEDSWLLSSDLEPRSKTYSYYYRCNIKFYLLYPEIKVKSIFKKHGFKTSFHGIKPHQLFNKLIINNKYETLFKLKQFKIISTDSITLKSIYNTYWRTIMLCIKNKYIIKDVSLYLDYLGFLVQLGKDLKSPKYIFPKNIKKEHDRYLEKITKSRRRKKLLDLKDKMDIDNKAYLLRLKKYNNLLFKKGNIVITPIKNVFEVEKEAHILKHCLFISDYHNKKNSLLLSAKVNGKNTETIEFNLKRRVVAQSRGINNSNSIYHSSILDLINKNINLIK